MPRAKAKKEQLQVKEAKPVTRRGKIANESTATDVETRTSRRMAGKKLKEPEGDIESIVIDEEVSFRRASLGDQGFSEALERDSPETVVEKTRAKPDDANVVGLKPQGRSARNSREKGLEDLKVGGGGVMRSKGAKKMKKDAIATTVLPKVHDELNMEECVEDDGKALKCDVKTESNTNKLSRLGNLKENVRKNLPGQYFFEVAIEGDVEDLEGNGNEGTTNGNVCVSPDIDQANNEPSLAGQSEKTVEGEKDVWATIVKTTRKDPRAQKLSYKKVPIVKKGSEKTDKGSQLPAESGNPLVNEDSGGLFTGIRTYGRKRVSARKKNSTGDDESTCIEAALSPKGQNLTELNRAEESDIKGVVERTSDVVVGKRAVEDTNGKDDMLERLAEDEWIAEVGARPALSAEATCPENSSYKVMTEDKSGSTEKNDEDDTESADLDDTLPVPDDLTNDDDGILETGPPKGDCNEKESGPPGRKTEKKTNTELDSTKLIQDAIPRHEEQTEEMHTLVSEVNTGPSDGAETARRSGRSRKYGKDAAMEIVGAPSVQSIKERSEAHESQVNNGATDSAESTRKGAKSKRNRRKAANKAIEDAPSVTEEQGEVNVSEEPESSPNGLAMDDGPPTIQEQTKGMDIQIPEMDMALMNSVPLADELIVRKSGRQRKKGKKTDKDEEIKATIGQETVVVAEVEYTPLTGANEKKSGRARKTQPANANTLLYKEEDKQEKALVMGCPPEENVRKSGRSRKNDKKGKEVVEVTSQVRDEDDAEACQQETVEMVASETTPPKSEEDVGKMGRTRPKRGKAKDSSSVGVETLEDKTAGIDTDQSQKIRKSGRLRKNEGKQEELSVPADSVESQEDKNDIQEAVSVDESEGIAVKRGKRLPRSSVEAKKNRNCTEDCERRETDVKDPLEPAVLQNEKSLGESVDDNNKNKVLKNVVIDVVETGEESVQEDTHFVDRKQKERDEDDSEACQQETEEMVASETTPPKSKEDVGKMGRTRLKRGKAKDLSSVGVEMEDKTAGVDTDQSQKIRKSGRLRKNEGKQEVLSVPADSVESQEDKNDIQEAVSVDESEGTAVKRGKRLPRSSVEAKKKRNGTEACERLETDVKDPLEPAELQNKKSFGEGVDDNNNNEVLKNVVIDVVETVEESVQEDTHCVDSKQKGRKDTRQQDYKESGHLMGAADEVSLGAEKMMAETEMSTIVDSDTQTIKKGGRSRKKGGKAARKPTKSEFPVIVETERVTSAGGVAKEDTSEVVLPEVVPGNQEIPHDQVPSIVESEPDMPRDSLTCTDDQPSFTQNIKTEPIIPLVQVPTLNIKNEPVVPVAPLGMNALSTIQNLKDEPINPSVPAQQQSVFIASENLENEANLTNVPSEQLSQELFSSDHVCDKEVEKLTDVGLALDGNRKRRLMSEDEMSPAKALKEYQSGFWDIVDGESECNVSSAFEVTADGLDLNGNDVTGPKGAVEVEADIHAEVDGTSATVKLPSDEFGSLKSCNRLQSIIGSMATADCDTIDEIVVEDLQVKAGGRKRGGNRGKATKRKPDEEEVKEVRKSKRNKKFEEEEDGAEAGGSSSGEAKPTRCYKIGPSRKEDMYVGAHVSISGGVHKAVANAVEVGARSFGLFLGSQRQWSIKPIPDEIVQKFRKACKEHNFPPHLILPHGSYLMNLGSPKPDLLQKSRDLLVKELSRCELLGLELFNFHPGSTVGETSVEDSILKIAESINFAHTKTKYCKTVIENMSCQGNTIGGKFSELRAINDLVKNKSRIGVCLDTCHAMAAGYDLSTEKGFNRMMDDFTSIIGLDYLVGVHLNDSVGKVGCNKDLHENIGQGKIGHAGFRRIMNDARFQNLPMILETPANIDDVIEIKLLYMMCRNK